MHCRIENINDFSDTELVSALSQMPINQREYIVNKKQPISKKQSIVARIILKNLLFEAYGINDGYNIGFLTNGKPYYLNSPNVHISLSHSGDYAAAVVSDKPIGIDIQVLKSVNKNLVKKVCTCDELDFVMSSCSKEFFRLWTVKEAYSKCTGIKLQDVLKLSFVNDNSIYAIDKQLYSFSNDLYVASIVE